MFLNGHGLEEKDERGERVVDDSFFICFNAHHEDIDFHMPPEWYGLEWEGVLDSTDPEMVGNVLATDIQRTVLVVDDEPTIRMLVIEVLAEQGYTVLEAGDGASALRLLGSGIAPDLLVTDVGLPGQMNGRQLADAAIARLPDLKVLFITGYAENAVIGNGQLAPHMALVTKPFAMDTLAAKVSLLLAG